MQDLRSQLANSLHHQLTPLVIFAWVVAIIASIITIAFIAAIVIVLIV